VHWKCTNGTSWNGDPVKGTRENGKKEKKKAIWRWSLTASWDDAAKVMKKDKRLLLQKEEKVYVVASPTMFYLASFLF
jgi:hypothetical protein